MAFLRNVKVFLKVGFDEVPAEEFNTYIAEKLQSFDLRMGDLRASIDPTASYASFVEYGKPPVTSVSEDNVVDSTAIVIDPDIKALPEPEKKEG